MPPPQGQAATCISGTVFEQVYICQQPNTCKYLGMLWSVSSWTIAMFRQLLRRCARCWGGHESTKTSAFTTFESLPVSRLPQLFCSARQPKRPLPETLVQVRIKWHHACDKLSPAGIKGCKCRSERVPSSMIRTLLAAAP